VIRLTFPIRKGTVTGKQKKKISARRLYRRKRLPVRGKRWKRRSKRGLYNVNYAK
jgi:hypothetical protein